MKNLQKDFLKWQKKHAYIFTKPLKDEESIETLKTQMHLEKFILEMSITETLANETTGDNAEFMCQLYKKVMDNFEKNNPNFNADVLIDIFKNNLKQREVFKHED